MRVIAVSDLAEAGREKPIVVSPAMVGFASPSLDYYEGGISLDKHLVANPESTFILKIAGDSMLSVGIFSGDEIIVDRSLHPQHGNIVVVQLGEDLEVKRLLIDSGGVTLGSDNPSRPNIRFEKGTSLSIWGVVVRAIHHYV